MRHELTTWTDTAHYYCGPLATTLKFNKSFLRVKLHHVRECGTSTWSPEASFNGCLTHKLWDLQSPVNIYTDACGVSVWLQSSPDRKPTASALEEQKKSKQENSFLSFYSCCSISFSSCHLGIYSVRSCITEMLVKTNLLMHLCLQVGHTCQTVLICCCDVTFAPWRS